ncbi:MAG: hypothetical protein NTV63_05845 [Candidatus Woesearchaeota archaeon]|nr:hypothetical protein [Candidatus Woesearchaeota archaeon]
MLKEIAGIKDMIAAAGNSLNTLHSIKHSEDAELTEWRSTLEDIERKIVYMDEALFGER